MHPIVKQIGPNPEQAPAVHGQGHDIVVTAGAGTGKTRTLVARYLALVASGLPLRSIIAITFTRKAAREMRNRVRNEIRRYLETPRLAEHERQRWQTLYAELDAARIGTIHSLCSEILHAHPAEAGVDPRFEVLDEAQSSIIENRALDEALAWATDDPDVVTLFPLLGEHALRDTLALLLGKRLEAETWFTDLPQPLWPVWEAQVVPRIRSFLEDHDVQAALGELLLLREDGTLNHALEVGDKLAVPLREMLALWDEIALAAQAGDWAAVSVRLAPLRAAMKLGGRAATWQPADPKAAIRTLRDAYETYTSAWQGKPINLALDRQLAEAAPLLGSLFLRARETYQRLKSGLQTLDYDDLEDTALRLLQQHVHVRGRWQRETQAILVDEFQDTNQRQRDLVALLNNGAGKLFIVGDAKQSIYRFRGADVTVFRHERERIEQTGGQHVRLETSYRAHRALVESLNDLLRPVLSTTADPDRPWIEPFAPLGHYRAEPGPGFVAPHIELHLTAGSKADGALERAADALVGRIVGLVHDGTQIVVDDKPRTLDYGDVAILCRASRSFAAYEDALDRAAVPYVTVAGRGFYKRPEIRDLLNALQALSDPTDDLALAGLLRSPAFALSDMTLYALCRARSQESDTCSLWHMLQTVSHSLPGDQSSRAQRALQLVSRLHGQVGRSSVADILKAFLDATSYRAALIQAGQPRAARNVTKLLIDAHTSGIVGVGEFLEYVLGLRDAGTREGEARSTAEGAVQIMTVHAAKGLEFPVVAIGDASHASRGGSGVLIDPDLGIVPYLKDKEGRLPVVYHLGKRRSDEQDSAESDRLLYVAATRAREKLLISGCITIRNDSSIGKSGGWLGRLAIPTCIGLVGQTVPYDVEGTGTCNLTMQMASTPVACTIYEPGYLWTFPPPTQGSTPVRGSRMPPPLLAPTLPESKRGDDDLDQRPLSTPQKVWRVAPAARRPRAPAWVIGSLVHEALASWRFPDTWSSDFEHWVEARASGYGIADTRQLADAARRTRQLLSRFQNHALYHEMDQADLRLHEVPYNLWVDDRLESGILDALYQQSSTWTLVEFKTNRVGSQRELEELLDNEGYAVQVQRYASAVEQLLGQHPRCVLCLLNFSGHVHLQIWDQGKHIT